jgi:D-serine dehydratase
MSSTIDLVADPSEGEQLDWRYKGLGPDHEGLLPNELAARRISLFDDRLFFPVAVIKESAVRHNRMWMRKFLKLTGMRIAPHGKTTMAPDLFRLQLEDGAWAITAATMHHVRAYRRFGVRRILLANQLVGHAEINWVIDELHHHPEFDFYVLVDSTAGVEALLNGAHRRSLRRPLKTLVEVGFVGGRCGVRSTAQGLEVANAVHNTGGALTLVGIETFEGIVQMRQDGPTLAEEIIGRSAELANECDRRGLFGDEIILSAGGSAYFDLVATQLTDIRLSRAPSVLIRSGCYLTHDEGMYNTLFSSLLQRRPDLSALGDGLKPALQIWARILSHPEPTRIICGFGKRDVGSDAGLPQPVLWARSNDSTVQAVPPGYALISLNDQHAFLDAPGDGTLEIGDFVGFGISHPCTTFDRWRGLLVIDDAYQVTGFIRTYF